MSTDTALWIAQGFLAVVFVGAGLIKLTQPREQLAAGHMEYAEDLTDGQMKAIGATEVLAAIGLILPPAIDVAPILAPIAAVGIVLLMIGAIATHLRRGGELSSVVLNVVLGAVAVFVAVQGFSTYAS